MTESTSHITWAPFSFLPTPDKAPARPQEADPLPQQLPASRRWTSNIVWAPFGGFLGPQKSEEQPAPSPLSVRATPSAPTALQVKKVLNLQDLSLPAQSKEPPTYPKIAQTAPLPVKKQPIASELPAPSLASLLGGMESPTPLPVKKQPTSSYPILTPSASSEQPDEPAAAGSETIKPSQTTPSAAAGSWKSSLGRFASAAAKMGDGATKKVWSTTRTYLPIAAFSLVPVLPQDHLKRLEGIDVEGPEYLTYVNEAVDYFMKTYASWPFAQRVVIAEQLMHQFCAAIKQEPLTIERQIGYQIGVALLSQKCTLEEVNHIYWLVDGEVTESLPDSFYQLIARQIINNWKLSGNWKEVLESLKITIPSCVLRKKDSHSSPTVDLTSELLHATAEQLFTPRLGKQLVHDLDREQLAFEVIAIYKHLKEYLSKDQAPELRHWKICSLIKTLFVYERDAFFEMAKHLTPLTRKDASIQELLLGIIA